jgi:hypothetical protein
MKRLIAFDAMHSRSFRERLAMGRSSRPRASSQRPMARAAWRVTCACHSSGLTGSARLGHPRIWRRQQVAQAEHWVGLPVPTILASWAYWRAAIAPRRVPQTPARLLTGVGGSTAAPGSHRLP